MPIQGNRNPPPFPTPQLVGSRGIGIHSLRKTAINDAIRNGATMYEMQEFAGHADIRMTEVSLVRKEEDVEVTARRIPIRRTGHQGSEPGGGFPNHSCRPMGWRSVERMDTMDGYAHLPHDQPVPRPGGQGTGF